MNHQTYLGLCSEAGLLVADFDRKLIEFQELEEWIAAADKQAACGSRTQVKAGIAPVDPVGAREAEFLFEFDADGVVDFDRAEASTTEDNLDPANLDRLLRASVKPVTADKYGKHWDKWIKFAAIHGVDVMQPDMRALEIFIADTSELSGSAGVATTAAAAVAHFVALEGHPSPFTMPRFSKMMRGIRLNHGKLAKPKKPFRREDIMTFMDLAYAGTLVEWRAAFPMALCFQQLLRGAECFDLSGANVVITAVRIKVTVETSKNHPEGFEFDVPVEDRLHHVGRFMVDYIGVMGIRVGDAGSHFACKLAKVKGILKAYPWVRVADATMRKACKVLIADSGLDPTLYATHSSKRGAALEALKTA
jgi:hypothetical protein